MDAERRRLENTIIRTEELLEYLLNKAATKPTDDIWDQIQLLKRNLQILKNNKGDG